MDAISAAKAIGPAKALLLNGCTLRLWADIFVGVCGAVGFAERMAACDQGHGFFVIHRHAAEGIANIKS